MSKHGGAFSFSLFLLLSIIILLQIHSMLLSDRLYVSINRLIDVYESAPAAQAPADTEGRLRGDINENKHNDEGDWLIWGFRVEPKTLNPYSANNDVYSRWITVPYIFEPLLVYDFNDLTMEPHLAESFKVSDNGLEITFRLREEICFSDGVPVTSDDVVFTYETAVNPKIGAVNVANLFADVDKITKVDNRVVKFIMKKRYFKALENLSFWNFGILPKHIYEFSNAQEFNRRISEPVGSGPFVFESWDLGEKIVLRRNENYWGDKPKLKKVVYRFITNPLSAVQALRSGQVDIIIPEGDQFAELVKDEQFRRHILCLSYWNAGAPFYFIGWNENTRFFSDGRVRLAMTHIINREQIVSELLKGYGRVITGPFYFQGSQNAPDIEPWPYDLVKASALLDEAGWLDSDGDGMRDKNGIPFRFKFMYAGDSVLYQQIAKVVKDKAAKVGIEVVPEPMEWSLVFNRITKRNFEAVIMGFSGGIQQDYYPLFHSSQTVKGGSNYVNFANQRADFLLDENRRTLDKRQRDELCQKFHRLLHHEQPYTFLFSRPSFRCVDKRFKNVNIYRLGLKYWQWYVPKERQKYK